MNNRCKVTADEKLIADNLLLAEAIFQLLLEKGFLTMGELLQRITELSMTAEIIIQNTDCSPSKSLIRQLSIH